MRIFSLNEQIASLIIQKRSNNVMIITERLLIQCNLSADRCKDSQKQAHEVFIKSKVLIPM